MTSPQLFLLDSPPARQERPRRLTIQESFEHFHQENPQVYRALVRLARKMRARGKRVGIGCLWEVARYFEHLRTDSDDTYHLNNNYRSRYAREIMEQEPDLADFFDLRELRS